MFEIFSLLKYLKVQKCLHEGSPVLLHLPELGMGDMEEGASHYKAQYYKLQDCTA
jgi:hypothetical protein